MRKKLIRFDWAIKKIFREVSALYPEYRLINVARFNEIARVPLDERIHFLKTEEIKPDSQAPGLLDVAEALSVLKLSDKDSRASTLALQDGILSEEQFRHKIRENLGRGFDDLVYSYLEPLEEK